ncbi:MAG: hypothetical protein ACXVQW_13105 [Actinomycetota bacterium]
MIPMFKKEWKKHLKAAEEVAEADPTKALELLDLAASEAPDGDAKSPRIEVLDTRARLNERLGRTVEAQTDRREIATVLEPELARLEEDIARRGSTVARTQLSERESLLVRMGCPADEIDAARRQYLEHLDADIKETKNHLFLASMFTEKEALQGRMGLSVDAARTRLLHANMLLAVGGDESARIAIATAPIFVAAYGARGFEFGETFTGSYGKSLAVTAEALRQKLVEEGRAIVLGRCGKCKAVIELTKIDHKPNIYERLKVRCPSGHKVTEFTFVVPEDAEATRRALAS